MKMNHRILPLRLAILILLLFLSFSQALAQELPLVVIVSTGGTISMKTEAGEGAVPELTGETLVKSVPGLDKAARIRVVDLCKIDSSRMTTGIWSKLSRTVDQALADPEVAGVVVTHGTDTMAEGAFFLDCTLKSDKTVVFTGAMRDASSLGAEGPLNLLNAVLIASSPQGKGWGVVVCLNDYINSARYVTKRHTSNVQAFDSGPKGCLGYIAGGQVQRWSDRPPRVRVGLREDLPRVPLISTFADADGALVRFAVDQGAKGLVVEALGAGNVNEHVFEAVKYALAKGVPVVITSRVVDGGVWPVYGGAGGGAALEKAGCIMGGDLPAPKARLLLMLALAQKAGNDELKALFR